MQGENTVKRFLITETMLNTLQSLSMPRHLAEELEVLKPIEPLSDDDIDLMWYEATAGQMHIKLDRAVVRHIFGEAP